MVQMLHQPGSIDRFRRRWALHRMLRFDPRKLCRHTTFRGIEHLAAVDGAALLVLEEQSDATVAACLLGMFHPPITTDVAVPETARRFHRAGNQCLDSPSPEAYHATLDGGGKLLIGNRDLLRQLEEPGVPRRSRVPRLSDIPRLLVTSRIASSTDFDLMIQPQTTEL